METGQGSEYAENQMVLTVPPKSETSGSETDKSGAFIEASQILQPIGLAPDRVMTILEKANYDPKRVRDAYEALQVNAAKVNDVFAWMVCAVKNGYKPYRGALSGTRRSGNGPAL